MYEICDMVCDKCKGHFSIMMSLFILDLLCTLRRGQGMGKVRGAARW